MGAACTTSRLEVNEPLPQIIAAITRNDPCRARVDLSCRSLGPRGVLEVASALCNNTVVTSLFLGWNDIEDSGLELVCNGVRDSYTLSTLILSGNKITDQGADTAAGLLRKNRSLTNLSLSANRITLAGATALLRAVETHPALRTLSLGGNQIASPTIAFVTETVRFNGSLCALELGGNPLPPECFAQLQNWCKLRQKTVAHSSQRPRQQQSVRAMSQCTNLSNGPRDDDLGCPLQWDERHSEAEYFPVEAASMMAQVCLSEKHYMTIEHDHEDPDFQSPITAAASAFAMMGTTMGAPESDPGPPPLELQRHASDHFRRGALTEVQEAPSLLT